MVEFNVKYSLFSSSFFLYLLGTTMAIIIGIIYVKNGINNRRKQNNKNKVLTSSNPSSDWGLNKWIPPRERRQYVEKKRIIIEKGKMIKTEEDEKILRDALLKRAISEIPVILEVQSQIDNENEGKQQKSSYDKIFMEKKVFVDDEIEDIKNEAEELLPGWGVQIWAQSMQLYKALEGHKKKLIREKRSERDRLEARKIK